MNLSPNDVRQELEKLFETEVSIKSSDIDPSVHKHCLFNGIKFVNEHPGEYDIPLDGSHRMECSQLHMCSVPVDSSLSPTESAIVLLKSDDISQKSDDKISAKLHTNESYDVFVKSDGVNDYTYKSMPGNELIPHSLAKKNCDKFRDKEPEKARSAAEAVNRHIDEKISEYMKEYPEAISPELKSCIDSLSHDNKPEAKSETDKVHTKFSGEINKFMNNDVSAAVLNEHSVDDTYIP